MVRPAQRAPDAPAASGSRQSPGTGCSSSVSALMTCSRGVDAANSCSDVLREGADDDARRPSARDCARRRRPARVGRARRRACSATTWPPSSRTAISNVVRVRSDGFSNSSATCRPFERVGGRRLPAERAVGLQPARRAPGSARDRRVEVEDRQKVLAGRGSWSRLAVASGSVVRVDAHVLRAQVAGPDRRRRAARRRGRRPRSRSVPFRYSAACGAASSCGRPSLKSTIEPIVHRRARQLEGDAGAAGHGDQPAPVRIAAVDRRLDQRRVGDRLRAPCRASAAVARAGDVHGDELGRAFAAADDAERQLAADGASAPATNAP